MSTNYVLRKGDNTKAFGNNFLEITLEKDENEPMPSKVEFEAGCIVKPFINPKFPLYVNFDEAETSKLNYVNVGYLKCYDALGQPWTAEGSITFYCRNGVICEC